MSSSFRRSGLSRLGGLVNNSLEDLGVRQKVLERQVLGKWKQIVGPHIAASSVPESVREGILFVCCKSSMWANELTFHKLHIIKEFNKAAGKKIVTDIRFTSRGFKKAWEQSLKEERSPETKGLESVPVDESVSELAAKLASVSPSEELAKKIEHAIITSKRREKVKMENEELRIEN